MKRFLIYSAVIIAVTLGLYFFHSYLVSQARDGISFSLITIYLFHIISFLIVCGAIQFLSFKLPSQVGYAYLASVFVKIGVFVLLFKDSIFAEQALNYPEKLSIVVPMFLYLIFEVVYCGRLMNTK